MPYPEQLIKVMREDLTQYGIAETKHRRRWTSFCSIPRTEP